MRTKRKTVPHYAHMFLYRQGIKILPSQNFIDKFKEIYNELLYKNKERQHIPPINDELAIFFINSLIEAVIYCIDFGYDVWFNRLLLFLQKKSDYIHNVKSHKQFVVEDVKKLTIRPIKSIRLRIKNKINKNNTEYCEFVEGKKEKFNNIKRYYREFYGKENEWWQGLSN